MRQLDANALVSVAAPLYNEAEGVKAFVEEVRASLRALALPCPYELVLVDDGSTDETGTLLDGLADAHPGEIRVVHLARNFGHAPAVAAALDHARGDVVILMDADHQDDPTAFAPFLEHWCEGYDVVYALRVLRPEGGLRRGMFWLFYRFMAWLANTDIPLDAGNFALMDRRVVDGLVKLRERNRYLPGLRAWVGYRQTGVAVPRRPRYDASTRVGLRGLWRLAMNAVFSFSYAPLFFFRAAGTLSIVFCALVILWAFHDKLVSGRAAPAWASEVVTVSFLGGLNLLGIGLLGEYIARIYDEVKQRPVYIIDRMTESDPKEPGRA